MQLEQVYYAVEILGVGAVIASLVFVGFQLRQNARASAIDARQTILDRHRETTHLLASDEKLSRITGQAVQDFECLSNADKAAFGYMMNIYASNLYNAVRLYEEGILEDEAFQYMTNAFVMTVRSKGGQVWWESVKLFYPPRLRQHVAEAKLGYPGDPPFDVTQGILIHHDASKSK